MKTLRFIGLAVLVLAVEFVLSVVLTVRDFNAAKLPYRRQERAAALEAYAHDRTPEKLAAYQKELRLAGDEFGKRQFAKGCIVFSFFLILDAIYIYRTVMTKRNKLWPN